MKSLDSFSVAEALAGIERLDALGIRADSGPLGDGGPVQTNLAAASVGVEPEKARREFIGYAIETPSPYTPAVSRRPELHPLAKEVRAICPGLGENQAKAIHQAALACHFPTSREQDDQEIQEAIAETVRDVLSGNRMMYIPPRILCDLMNQARHEAKMLPSRPRHERGSDLTGLRHSLKELSRKFDNYLKLHDRCFTDRLKDEEWARKHGFAYCEHDHDHGSHH